MWSVFLARGPSSTLTLLLSRAARGARGLQWGAGVLAPRRMGGVHEAREAPGEGHSPLPQGGVHSVAVPGVRRGVPAPPVHPARASLREAFQRD
jgi:hypothetical protein